MTIEDRLKTDAARARFACHVAGYALGVSDDLLTPERGSTRAAFARQVAMYLAHVGCGMSLHRVAVAFGRDRSTVAHACHLMEDRRDDARFDDLLNALEAVLRSAPEPAIDGAPAWRQAA